MNNERYKKIDCDEAEVLRWLGVPVYGTTSGIYGILRWSLNVPCTSTHYKWDWYVKLGEDDDSAS